MSSIAEGFSSRLKAMTIAGVGGVDLDGEFRPGVESVFFEGKGQ